MDSLQDQRNGCNIFPTEHETNAKPIFMESISIRPVLDERDKDKSISFATYVFHEPHAYTNSAGYRFRVECAIPVEYGVSLNSAISILNQHFTGLMVVQ